MMWPYAARGSRVIGDAAQQSPSRLEGANFSTNNDVIKLWLPEKLLAAIDVLCDAHDASRPDVLRWVLFEHAFGRVEFAHLQRRVGSQADHSGIMRSSRRAAGDEPLESARAINARFLGKATGDFKLFLPSVLKSALESLAASRAAGLSDYLRGVLARELLGESFYAEWQQALAHANVAAASHESVGSAYGT